METSEITSAPLEGTLSSVQEGRAVVLEYETLVNAFSGASVLSIGYALAEAVPLFADALR